MSLSDIPVLIHQVQHDAGRPFAARAASTLLGRLTTRWRSWWAFSTILAEAHLWGHTRMLEEKAWLSVSAWIDPSGVLAGSGRVFVQASQVHPPDSATHAYMDLACCTRKGQAPNSSHKVGNIEMSTMSWYGEASEFLSLGPRDQAQLLKNKPTPSPPLHQTLHSAQPSQTSPVKPRLVHHIAKWRSVIRHSMKLSVHRSWVTLKAAWSLEVWPLRTLGLTIRWPRSVTLRGPPLWGWVFVVPTSIFLYYSSQLTVEYRGARTF